MVSRSVKSIVVEIGNLFVLRFSSGQCGSGLGPCGTLIKTCLE